ncbi:hypothetical protein HDZ31DRAFT_75257 [Schizophyllum fasciatum]
MPSSRTNARPEIVDLPSFRDLVNTPPAHSTLGNTLATLRTSAPLDFIHEMENSLYLQDGEPKTFTYRIPAQAVLRFKTQEKHWPKWFRRYPLDTPLAEFRHYYDLPYDFVHSMWRVPNEYAPCEAVLSTGRCGKPIGAHCLSKGFLDGPPELGYQNDAMPYHPHIEAGRERECLWKNCNFSIPEEAAAALGARKVWHALREHFVDEHFKAKAICPLCRCDLRQPLMLPAPSVISLERHFASGWCFGLRAWAIASDKLAPKIQ